MLVKLYIASKVLWAKLDVCCVGKLLVNVGSKTNSEISERGRDKDTTIHVLTSGHVNRFSSSRAVELVFVCITDTAGIVWRNQHLCEHL